MSKDTATKEYYDSFSRRVLLRDFRYLNLRHEAIKLLYGRYVPRGARVLDVGCGVGILARFLQRKASFVLAVDVSEENVRVASRYAGSDRCEVRCLDIVEEADELRKYGTFDVVVLPDVIEHIRKANYAGLFAAIEKVLSPDGRVILTFPSPEMQEHLETEKPEAMQLHEEKVEATDILGVTSLKPIYFAYQNVFGTNDYVHFVLAARREYSTHGSAVSLLRRFLRRLRKYRWRIANAAFLRKIAK
ncbi:MAG: methyltransferase domain-containing protein [Candidatus Latescibacteria bacterium]|nr:methyltransferase domain-containing protein [Candidatus Latescibacterota bacterium]NIO01023.1 methyltransferase domain-containing protein [Candidatus Latescibacterota bacterium]NIO27422.1 methyltransferase domain-containing protein [Candidatus Latescibacterota bacterium]NIO54944.1 methyltransferase domain-containing protein [Candidatus Latescibacterota bacterium]NIT01033.1 methyltransferase domain-containing protein [Candidatus Latescibacterota bacterium]